jgi:hypothetical protein
LANERSTQRHAVNERLAPTVCLVGPVDEGKRWQDGVGGEQVPRVGQKAARRNGVDEPSEAVSIDGSPDETPLLVPGLRVRVVSTE